MLQQKQIISASEPERIKTVDSKGSLVSETEFREKLGAELKKVGISSDDTSLLVSRGRGGSLNEEGFLFKFDLNGTPFTGFVNAKGYIDVQSGKQSGTGWVRIVYGDDIHVEPTNKRDSIPNVDLFVKSVDGKVYSYGTNGYYDEKTKLSYLAEQNEPFANGTSLTDAKRRSLMMTVKSPGDREARIYYGQKAYDLVVAQRKLAEFQAPLKDFGID